MTQREVLLFYLFNLSRAKMPRLYQERILNYVEESSETLFGYDVCDIWGVSEHSVRFRHRRENPDASDTPCTRNMSQLSSLIVKANFPNIYGAKYDSSMSHLCNLLKLPSYARPILYFLVNIARYPDLRHLFSEIIESRFSCDLNLRNVEVFSYFCGVSESQIKNSLEEDNVLATSGVLRIDSDGDINLHSMFRKALSYNTGSVDKLKRRLLGAPLRGDASLDFSHISADYDCLRDLLSAAITKGIRGINILIHGPTGTGKTELAKQIVSSLGCDLYTMPVSNKKRTDRHLSYSYLLFAQRILARDDKSVILLDEAEDVFRFNPFSNEATSKLGINTLLEQNIRPVIWITNNVECMDDAYIRRFSYCLELGKPAPGASYKLWSKICAQHKLKLSEADLLSYSRRYNVSPGVISNAVRAAKLTGRIDSIPRTIDSLSIAMTGVRHTAPADSGPEFDLSLLNTDTDLSNLADRLIATNNHNFSLCLYGVSGTGKSAYARYLAQRMGIPHILKRASDLKGKYVGETEKNIAAAFRQAEQEGAMLIFDEADSFLMDRTRASANWEVSCTNEMLTQMESAKIPFVCTTNLMRELDSASLRRFLFKVKYDYLTPAQVISAFRHFFDLTPSDTDIRDLTNLTPGDFAVVLRKSKVLNITALPDLIQMLREEMSVKRLKTSNRIGF